MRLGILGGTFDPPHIGHLILAHCAYAQLKLDRVLFLPAGDPWRKSDRAITTARHRVEMVRLAVGGDSRFVLDEREVRRGGPSYTVDSLRELRAELGETVELCLLLGQDALDDLPNWHEPRAILSLARLAVAPRPETPALAPPEGGAATNLDLPPCDRIEMPFVGISASDLRARAARGESLRYLTPDAVDAYVREHQLYRTGPYPSP